MNNFEETKIDIIEETRRTFAVETYIKNKIKCDVAKLISLFYLTDWQHAIDYGFVITRIKHTKPLGIAVAPITDSCAINEGIKNPYVLTNEEKESIDYVIEQCKNTDIEYLVNQTYPMYTALEDNYIDVEKLAKEFIPPKEL